MKKVIFLILLLPAPAFAQVADDFESGLKPEWIQNSSGRWNSDTTRALSGERSLHHIFDNSSSGNDCIGISLRDLHPEEGTIKWSFSVRHGYDPSSSNNWFVFLMCDADPASVSSGTGTNGFVIGVNLTGYDDTLRLWKLKNGLISTVIKTGLNWQNRIGTKNPAKIEVERSPAGIWNISVKDIMNEVAASASAMDKELFASEWFIVDYRYTSTRDMLLWFDDLEISGIFYEDNDPPSVNEIEVKGRNSLEVVFDEEPDVLNTVPSNFLLEGNSDQAINVIKISNLRYRLDFSADFNNKTENHLYIRRLCDKNGNCIESISKPFTPVWAEPGDIIISEVMADPSPPVSLPQKEYLEITNRSKYPLNIKKWSLSFNEEKVMLPSQLISPGEFRIMCYISDTSLFRNYGRVTGLKPFPSLSDDGKILVLNDSLGNLIHGVEYSSAWYGDALKRGGGWSLEIIDTDSPFFTEGNWEASSSGKGGTPGRVNSGSRINEDPLFKGILNAFPSDSNNIIVTFSETIIGLPCFADNIYLDEEKIISLAPSDLLQRSFLIKPGKALERGKIYSVVLPADLTDFAGNQIVTNKYRFGIPEIAGKEDVVFNELLFNPLPGDPDFIELYNCSGKVLDVAGLYLASINETGDTSGLLSVSAEKRCLLPGSYYVLTSERGKITSRYNSAEDANIFNASQMPSMPDDRGHLLLLNSRAEIIDEVIYTESMHHPLLSGNEGIALEKFRPGISSSDPASWHSASESAGWGTPGAANSIYVPDPGSEDIITFSSTRISPDNDGFEDILVIDLNLEGTGNVLSVTVFDETGAFIRKIAENFFAGPAATLSWDGTANDGTLVRQGIYVVFIQLYNETGKTKTWKKVCTVIR